MAEDTLHAVGPSAAGAAGGHCSDDVGYSASEDDYSTVTPGSDTESSGSSSDSQILAHGNDLGMPPESDTSTSPQRTSLIISNPKSDSTSTSDSSKSEAVARRREEQTIPHKLPKLVARLLRSKKVREKIAGRLRKHGISFKFDQAQYNIIHVKPALKLDKVKSVLENDIFKPTFCVQEGDLEDRGIIESLNSKELQDQMVMEYENGTLSIVYHKSIGDNISTYLEMLKNPQKQLSLFFKSARYLERHMQRFDETFHTRLTLSCQVKLSLAGGRNNAPCLVVTCHKPYSRDAFSKVEEHIACLGQSDVEVSLATGLYLQSRHGERVLKETEEIHHCVLDVETPVQRVLLRASSSNHQLLVCEGNMAATDCHVIVLPLYDGQKEWPPLYKHIMDRECLSDEAHRFLSKVGLEMWVHSTRCTGGTSKRHIIVMFVPSLSNNEEFQCLLQTSCKAAMDSAIYDNPQTDIALPLKLGDHLPLKTCVMPMMMAVVESIQGNRRPDDALHVKLYLDKLPPDTTQLLVMMENRLPLCGWSLDTFFGNTGGGQISHRKQHLRDKALVRVFGLKEDAEKASNKVTNIEAPHDYKERAENFKSLESLLDASSKGASRSTVPKSNTTAPVSSDKSENETGEATPASTPATPNKTAFVQICGQKVQVNAALEELRKEVKHRLDSLDSSADPDHYNQPVKPSDNGDHTKPPPDRQVLGQCTVSIPEDCFEEGEKDALLKDSHLSEICKMKIDHSTHVPSITFEVKGIEDLDAAVKRVLDCINQRKQNRSGLNPPQPHVHHPEGVTKELDSKAVEALQALMKEDFSKVDVEKTSGYQVKICCHGPAAQDIMNRIDSLRQEEVPLSDSDFEKIRDPVDTTAEGVAAYLIPVPDKGRVVIFSFDYSALSKAKHLLNVKLGKVKMTSRARRRFDGRNTGADSGSTNQSPTHSLDYGSSQPVATGVAKDFTTKSGIKVMVYKTDITKLPVDAIANAANEHLAHGGGVAYAIAKAAGFSLESEGQDYIQRNGPLKVREVVATTGGSLPCQKVLHAVGPRWSDYKDKAQCQEHLADTVYNCLHKADSMQLASLAIPSISSAIFGVPKDVCARSYLSAIQSFDRQCGDGTCLRQIHFVDVSEDMINVIQQTFTQHWNTDVQPSMARKSSEEKRSQPTSAQEAQQSSGSVTVSPAASTGGIAGESLHHLPATGNSFQAEQDPRIPVLKIFPGSQKGEAEYQFQFCGLDLILLFRQGTVADAKTEAVVLWQKVGSVGRDKNFQQLANSLNQSAWKTVMSLTSEGSIQCVNAGSQILICPLVSPYAALSEETVQSFVERSISEADMRGKRSVTIPTFLPTSRGSRECNKELADFATGVYTAVRNYTSRPRRFVREIHVIHQGLQVIRSMSEWVEEKAATDMSMVDNKPRERSQSAKTEQAVTCVICYEAVTNPKSLTCGHTFCTHCIGQWLSHASKCPTCNKIQGVLTGKQPPDGRMEMYHSGSDLPGYQGCGSLTIKYDFPAGRQTDEHPNPGRWYRPETRVAYLPNTLEGRKVLMLLKTAFDRRLVFTVGQSSTTGHTGIIWNDIHHKTFQYSGGSSYGYPDPEYLKRVQEELAVKGMTEADLTDRQRDFIQNPGKYTKYPQRDFSHLFNNSESSKTVV